MRTVTVDEKHHNLKIDRFMKEIFPQLPSGFLYKALRKKDIKANGVRVKEDYLVQAGDRLEIYIIDELLEGISASSGHKLNQGFSIVFEDQNLLIVNKEQGVPVHPDREQSSGTLIDLVKSYLEEKKEYRPGISSFTPSLCHRLDRNTGGIVLLAKNRESLETIIVKMESGEVRKYYQCLVKGRVKKNSEELRDYLVKDEKKSRVFISREKVPGSLEIITKYRCLSYDSENDISRLEVELVTGRTHQIRAHLAFIGHPIIGDGKYGTNAINRQYKAKYQALWAYKIVFDFREAGILSYLRGKQFMVEPEFKGIALRKRVE